MADELPDIEQRFLADVTPYIAAMDELIGKTYEAVAAVEALKTQLASLPDDKTIRINIETTGGVGGITGVAAGAAAVRTAAREAAVAAEEMGHGFEIAAGDGRDLSASMVETIAAVGATTGAEERLFAVSTEGVATTVALTEAFKENATAAVEATLAADALASAEDSYNAGAAAGLAGRLAAAKATVALSQGYKEVGNGARLAADAEAFLTGATINAGNAFLKTGDGAAKAAGTFRIWGTGIRLTGNAMHWLAGVTVEALAVTIPAAVAGAAGAWVLYQGVVENVGRQMQALTTVTEATGSMIGKSAGQVLGLSGALQKAQDAANPAAYELLGASINAARVMEGQFAQEGLAVAHVLDEFAARVNVDLRGALGTQLQGLIAGGVQDLTMLGQVLGNVGHAILNLASDMPGLAEVLLKILDAASRLVLVLTEIPAPILTMLMAGEEFIRWGGLAVNIMGRLAGAIAKIPLVTGAAEAGLKSFAGATTGAAAAEKAMAAGATEAEAAQARANASTLNWKGSLQFFARNPFGWAIAAAAGVAALAMWLRSAKTPADNLAAAIEQDVHAAQGMSVLTAIHTGMTLLNASLEQNAQSFHQSSAAAQGMALAMERMIPGGNIVTDLAIRTSGLTSAMNNARGVLGGMGGAFGMVAGAAAHLWASFTGAATAVRSITDLSAAQRALMQQQSNVVAGAAQIAQMYHVSLPEAYGIASMAGVDLTKTLQGNSQAALVARMQIADLMRGYRAMGTQEGVIGADMNAVNLQLQIQGTKVQQVNGAWDNYISMLTGSTQALASFNVDIHDMGNVLTAVGRHFRAFGGDSAQSIQQVAQALRSFGGQSAQVWQNFDSSVQQANAVMDQMRTAAAAGAVSQSDYMAAIRGTVAELIPYAAQSKTAQEILVGLAQQNGLGITSFKGLTQWVGNTHRAQDGLTQAVENATGKMASLSAAVQNFSGTLKSDALNAIAQGSAQMGEITNKTQAFTSALQHNSAQSLVVRNDASALAGMLEHLGFSSRDTESVIYQLARSEGVGAAQAHALAAAAANAAGAVNSIPSNKTVNIDYYVNWHTSGAGRLGFGQGRPPLTGATGGMVHGPGGPTGDRIPALLSDREFVMSARSVEHYGEHFMHAVNSMKLAAGGMPKAMLSNEPGSRGGGFGVSVAAPAPEVHVHLHGDLADESLWERMQTNTLRYGLRSSGQPIGLWSPVG